MFTNSKSRIVASILLLGTTGLAFPVCAQDEIAAVTAAEQINSANEMVRQGDFDKAIEEYQRVTVSAKDRDELNYNQAVARYRKGDVETAEALFTEAASSNDTSIAASSRYNLGNCLYAKALQSVEQDKPAAIEQLRQAIDHYRGSLNGNPENPDARANIELAAELIKKLQEEQKQDDQQQQQDQQKQDQQQQDQQQQDQQQQDQQQQDGQQSQSENAYSQKSDSGESDPQDSKPSGDAESKGNEDQQQQDQANEPKSDDQQSEQKQEQGDSQPQDQSTQNQSDQSKTDNKQSQDEQSSSPGQQSPEQPTDQRQSQPGSQGDQPPQNERQPARETGDENDDQSEQQVPTGELTSAGQADENEKPNASAAMADPNAKDGLMTQEEALKMLQAVRDRDMLRRLKQQQQERSRHVPVDRDW